MFHQNRHNTPAGFVFPTILLPKPGIDLRRWAVIACDQFTSEPDYWAEVARIVADAPSTYNLILPEAYLGSGSEEARIQRIRATMDAYLTGGVLREHSGAIYVERTCDGRTRRGVMLCLDLEEYDYRPGSQSLVRATEGTILDRIPPRVRIRDGAPLELPHVVVLIDDPGCTVIEPIAAQKAELEQLYDVELMLGGGHLTGYSLSRTRLEQSVRDALLALASPAQFQERYGTDSTRGALLFAVGDGNHSLATAKTIWERVKVTVGPNHPLRYALVEVENVHDSGLQFEPIHRVLFDVQPGFLQTLVSSSEGGISYRRYESSAAAIQAANAPSAIGAQSVGVIQSAEAGVLEFHAPSSPLTVGTLQLFLDRAQSSGLFRTIDYVHGTDSLQGLASHPGNIGIWVPTLPKGSLFTTVLRDGVLPRKTFSMGHAHEKRFYMECRKIT